MAKRNGSRLILDTLQAAGVDMLFGYPGGQIMPFFDELFTHPIEHVLSRHEQMAVHAADGYARSSGKLGVVVSTSGPGATNLVTGICTAMMDSVPLLCISGQVPTTMLGSDAFQEADVFGLATAITKHAYLVRSMEELPRVIAEAIFVATTGRPGPVLIDLPRDIQLGETDAEVPVITGIEGYDPFPATDLTKLEEAHELLKAATKPVVIIGGGCRAAEATEAFRRFCDMTQVPVVNTMHGTGATAPDYAGRLGMVGVHGLWRANRAVCGSDLIIAMGMRMDDRVTGKVQSFAPKARIVHIDIDAAELDKLVPTDIALNADLRSALEAWNELLAGDPIEPFNAWRDEAFGEPGHLGPTMEDLPGSVYPTEVLDAAVRLITPKAFVTTDVGQNQMWTCQRACPDSPRKFLSSGGAGTMGYGLPSAIGAALANPGEKVMAVVGDGGFQMALGEMITLNRLRLPVKILLLDNSFLGMVRQWQELYFGGRYSATVMDDNPDFVALAKVLGIDAIRLDTSANIASSLEAWWNTDQPSLLHVVCHPEESVFPMVSPGVGLENTMATKPEPKD
jgi:acetolactate synthase-1/2/3 large subunit